VTTASAFRAEENQDISGKPHTLVAAPATSRLRPYLPKFTSKSFWAVQILIIAVAGVHTAVEVLGILEHEASTSQSSLSFVPVALFFIPVVYAALNFGFAGSVATATWCTILSLPNVVFIHHGYEAVADAVQIGIVDVMAVFVGQRAEREMSARRRAEAAGVALTASEKKYRGLFESSPTAVLVFDRTGRLLEANPAAGLLFERTPLALGGVGLADLVGGGNAQALLSSLETGTLRIAPVRLKTEHGAELRLEPSITVISNDQAELIVQAQLRDVTEEWYRQVGLRAYAAHVLRVQEEERKHIAQELHDDTVQKLILLCRQLDLAEAAGEMDPRLVDVLRDARRSAEEIVGGLRNFAKALRPPSLDDLGLVASVRQLVQESAERAKFEARLKVVGEEVRLPANVELAVFRIAQEALHNVERHANATRVVVTLDFTAQGVKLRVADNGTGFALPFDSDLAATGKLGLLGMRERAESLGGRLEIRSSTEGGTQVVALIPAEHTPPSLPISQTVGNSGSIVVD